MPEGGEEGVAEEENRRHAGQGWEQADQQRQAHEKFGHELERRKGSTRRQNDVVDKRRVPRQRILRLWKNVEKKVLQAAGGVETLSQVAVPRGQEHQAK